MKEIILIGGGGHCKSVIDVIEQESQFVIVGIVDQPKLIGTDVLGYPVIGRDSDLESLAKKYTYALVTVGQIRSSEARIKLFNLLIKVHIGRVITPFELVSCKKKSRSFLSFKIIAFSQ